MTMKKSAGVSICSVDEVIVAFYAIGNLSSLGYSAISVYKNISPFSSRDVMETYIKDRKFVERQDGIPFELDRVYHVKNVLYFGRSKYQDVLIFDR